MEYCCVSCKILFTQGRMTIGDIFQTFQAFLKLKLSIHWIYTFTSEHNLRYNWIWGKAVHFSQHDAFPGAWTSPFLKGSQPFLYIKNVYLLISIQFGGRRIVLDILLKLLTLGYTDLIYDHATLCFPLCRQNHKHKRAFFLWENGRAAADCKFLHATFKIAFCLVILTLTSIYFIWNLIW